MLAKIALFLQSKIGLAVLGAVIVGGSGTAAVAVTVSHTPITLPIVGQIGGSGQDSNGNGNNGNTAGSTHAHTVAILGTLQGATTCPTDGTAPDSTQISQISVMVTNVSAASTSTSSTSSDTSTQGDTSTSTSTSTSATSTLPSDTSTSTSADTSTSTSTSADTSTSTSTSADTSTSTSTSTDTSTSTSADTSTSTPALPSIATSFTVGQAANIAVADGYTRVTGAHANSLAALCGATGQRVEVNATLQSDGTYKAWKVTVQGGPNSGGQGNGNGNGQGNGNGNGQGNGNGNGQGNVGKSVHVAGKVGVIDASTSSFTFEPGSSAGGPPAGIANGAPIRVTVTGQTVYAGKIGSLSDLKTGMSVMIDGTVASDGSIQATKITAMGH